MPLRNWQQHAEPASAPPAIDGARETGQPVLPRGRVLRVNECVSQGLSSQKRHPAELDNVDQLIYDMCGRLQVSAWLRPADAAALLLDGQKLLAAPTYTVGCALLRRRDPRVGLFFRSEGSACGGVMGPRVVCLVLLYAGWVREFVESGACLLRNTSVERTRSLSFHALAHDVRRC